MAVVGENQMAIDRAWMLSVVAAGDVVKGCGLAKSVPRPSCTCCSRRSFSAPMPTGSKLSATRRSRTPAVEVLRETLRASDYT